jgi:hypothetical protein
VRTRDLFDGCYVCVIPYEDAWTVRLVDESSRPVKSAAYRTMEGALHTVQQWLVLLDDDTQILDEDPSMLAEVADVLREAILSMAIGEQASLPGALTALLERDRLRSWFNRQMDLPDAL